jgi:HD superfamily phosphohydrolase YqeK
MIKSFKEYKSFLKKHLNKDRYNHSISTAKFMKKYAECYNIDKGKAYIAGLLHDLARSEERTSSPCALGRYSP